MNLIKVCQLTATRLSKFNLTGLQYSKRFHDTYEIEAGDLKKGVRIEYKNKLLEATKVEHQKVAMRGGFILADFKNVLDGTKASIKFRSAETLEAVEINKKTYVRIPNDEGKYLFRDIEADEEDEDTEIIECEDKSQLNNYDYYFKYLPEDSEYQFREYNGHIIDFTGPKEITLPIKKISNLGNNLVLFFENGRTSKGPSHLKEGDHANIRLPDEIYLSSSKSIF